jgi:uncharacterized damage-inducible protein DinB
MSSEQDKTLREHLVRLLSGEGAHLGFEDVTTDIPAKSRGAKPSGMPHSPWRLLEHMRLAQHDILDFCTNPKYEEMEWPADYWPKTDGPANDQEWNKSIGQFQRDLKALQELVSDPKTDLFAKIPWGEGQTYLREALLAADHNAYHLGEIVAVRRALGAWPE